MKTIGRVLAMIATLAGFAMIGAFAGYMIGEFAPSGVAQLAEPGSPLRDVEARRDAVIGGITGIVLGIILTSQADRKRE